MIWFVLGTRLLRLKVKLWKDSSDRVWLLDIFCVRFLIMIR